ncbi:hypothetical protein FGD67_11150 [Colwellia sp. M166]|nr:hypothetical protein FGD67_11150 [Colwellia sp. M166]
MIEGNGYSRQLLLRCSNDSHPCDNLVDINNVACKAFKINLGELTSDSITAVDFLHIELYSQNDHCSQSAEWEQI